MPAELVRELGWKPGTRLDWQKLDDNSLIARPLPSRGEIARRVMGLAKLQPGSDPVSDLQQIQEQDGYRDQHLDQIPRSLLPQLRLPSA